MILKATRRNTSLALTLTGSWTVAMAGVEVGSISPWDHIGEARLVIVVPASQ